MATVMREFALRVRVEGTVVDSVGTGGDGTNTFNISTAAALVAAGAGVRIAKHGNRAASGSCGAADVLEALGVRVELPPEGVERCINEGGIGFMFAQAFHPSMRHAGPVRREIGIRTVFNILGPLTNPAFAQRQLIGVAFPQLGEKMAEVLRLLGSERSLVVHGAGGLDEIALDGDTSVWELRDGSVSNWTFSPDGTGPRPLERRRPPGWRPRGQRRYYATPAGRRGGTHPGRRAAQHRGRPPCMPAPPTPSPKASSRPPTPSTAAPPASAWRRWWSSATRGRRE